VRTQYPSFTLENVSRHVLQPNDHMQPMGFLAPVPKS
jgi:hypothetical protein